MSKYTRLPLLSERCVVLYSYKELSWVILHLRGKEYGNHQGLKKLKRVWLKTSAVYEKAAGDSSIHGEEWIGHITLENKDKVPAVMLRLNLIGRQDGKQILPAFYEDNYFSLMPGEKKTVTVKCYVADTRGNAPKVLVTGYNL